MKTAILDRPAVIPDHVPPEGAARDHMRRFAPDHPASASRPLVCHWHRDGDGRLVCRWQPDMAPVPHR